MPFLTVSHRKLWPSSRRWRAWRRRGWPWTTRVLWRRSWRHSVSKWSTTVKNLRLEEQIWCGGVGSRTWGWASEAGSFFSFSDIEDDKSPMLPTTSVRMIEDRWSQPSGAWCLLLLNSFLLLCLFSRAVPSSPPFSLISCYFQQRIRSSWKSPHLCVKEGRTERKESWLLTCRLILNDRFSGESEKCACNGVASP